ncbi:kinase-like protein [Sistotremastrum suecicum HHB10207 ss-3]|uniref:Kinase-like protein n=1 Tax=Sistotremastrum suecicum HHB10207 ss-3 TaxID=1314776 RepID=A0A166A6N1_9AGAM|nr:kinase-like protein [Sistotremastrum suecicum HHB10207 ss-3]
MAVAKSAKFAIHILYLSYPTADGGPELTSDYSVTLNWRDGDFISARSHFSVKFLRLLADPQARVSIYRTMRVRADVTSDITMELIVQDVADERKQWTWSKKLQGAALMGANHQDFDEVVPATPPFGGQFEEIVPVITFRCSVERERSGNPDRIPLGEDFIEPVRMPNESFQRYELARTSDYVINEGTHGAVNVLRMTLKEGTDDPMENVLEASGERFLRSLRRARNLRHENIMPLLGYTCDEVSFSLVIRDDGEEFVTLDNLPMWRVPWGIKMGFIIGVAKAVEFLHFEGIVHGCIRPGNVLVGLDNRPLLFDMGALGELQYTSDSRLIDQHNRWMSPQIVQVRQGNGYHWMRTQKSDDIWALACLITMIFSNHIPYHAQTSGKVHKAMLSGMRPYELDQPEVSQFASVLGTFSTIFPELWGTCLGCWGFDPRGRPTAMDVAKETVAAAHMRELLMRLFPEEARAGTLE